MKRSRNRPSAAVLALLATLITIETGQGVAGTTSLGVDGTLFRVTLPDGRVLTSPDLIGAVFDAVDDAGRIITLRVDGVTRDPSDRDGDVWLHRLSVPAIGAEEGSREYCSPGPDGTRAGFPLAGTWTKDGRHERRLGALLITCTSGAVGKCVRMGYKPWRKFSGQDLWDYHQACVRALRADYGGDGAGYTRNGTRPCENTIIANH